MAWNFDTILEAKRFMDKAMKYAHEQNMDYDTASCFIHNRIREFKNIVYPDSDAHKHIEVKDIMHYSIDYGVEMFKNDYAVIMAVVYTYDHCPVNNYTVTGVFPVKREGE
jgi:hypothetical protein